MNRSDVKVILILGAGIMQLPAIRAARKKNWTVFAADGSSSAPGIPLADHFLHIDLKDKEGMAAAAAEIRKKRLDGVFTAGTDFSTTVAYVAEKLGLPGIPYTAALAAKDKGMMRRVFADAGVPSPAYTVVRRGAGEPIPPSDCPDFPLVVKPVDSMGARGVRMVRTESELSGAVDAALAYSTVGTAVIEEYIPGPEFSIDALVWDGKITPCGFADRHITFSPYFVEMGHTLPSRFPESVADTVLETFFQAVRALGITVGAAKGDVKLSPSGPVVGEIAARLSGGYMSGWTYPYSSGVDLTSAALNIAVGLPPGDLSPKHHRVSAERAIISIPGRIAEISGAEEAGKPRRVRDVFMSAEPGKNVVFPSNNVEKCGNVIAAADRWDDAAASAEGAAKRIRIRLEPGNPDTLSFLCRRTYSWAPDAFILGERENRKAYEQMSRFIIDKDSGGSNPGSGEKRFGLLMLPNIEEESSVDWMGRGFREAFSEVRERCSIVQLAPDTPHAGPFPGVSAVILGAVFWQVFLRGGIQGAVWLCETCLECTAEDFAEISRKLWEGARMQGDKPGKEGVLHQ